MVTGAVAGPLVIAGSIVTEVPVCAKQAGAHKLTAMATAITVRQWSSLAARYRGKLRARRGTREPALPGVLSVR